MLGKKGVRLIGRSIRYKGVQPSLSLIDGKLSFLKSTVHSHHARSGVPEICLDLDLTPTTLIA